LPPQGARQIHPLSGVNSNPPALRVDSLVNLYVFYRADGEVGLRPIKTFIWALSFTLVSAYHIYSYTNTRNIANDAAAKIAEFRTKHGIYPVSLGTIGVLNNAGFVRMRISYAYDPSAPRLFYLDTFLPFHVNFYDFDSGEWWTYAADLRHVNAAMEGSLAETETPESLGVKHAAEHVRAVRFSRVE